MDIKQLVNPPARDTDYFEDRTDDISLGFLLLLPPLMLAVCAARAIEAVTVAFDRVTGRSQ